MVESLLKFPPLRDCLVFDILEKSAYLEMAIADKEQTLYGKGFGYYQCHCKAKYKAASVVDKIRMAYSSDENGVKHICYEYAFDESE